MLGRHQPEVTFTRILRASDALATLVLLLQLGRQMPDAWAAANGVLSS